MKPNLSTLINRPPRCPDCLIPLCPSHEVNGHYFFECHECKGTFEWLDRTVIILPDKKGGEAKCQ